MMDSYPEPTSREFPAPPRTATDEEGREIAVERSTRADVPDLLAMYEAFDPADRAQGIPPVREPAIERWLESVLAEECLGVLAYHDDRVVGHAMLVPDGDGGYELAIFVRSEYQGAGVGTAVLETLLGLGQREGVDRVWLTVERWNDAARALYRSVGFQRRDDDRFEVTMAMRI